MKRLIIEVDDGVNLQEAMMIVTKTKIHEEFVISMKVEVVNND